MKPRMIILFGLMTFLLLASACKPKSGSKLAQQMSTTSAPLIATATVASAAPATTVTATVSQPPACQFDNTNAPSPGGTPVSNLNAYVFSPPTIVLTSPASSAAVAILQWLPDSTRLLAFRRGISDTKHTIETFDTLSKEWHAYAQSNGTRAFWVPQKQTVVYDEHVPIDAQNGVWHTELWASDGVAGHSERIAERDSSVLIDESRGWVVRRPSADTSPSASSRLAGLLPTYSLSFDPRERLGASGSSGNKNWESIWNVAVDDRGERAVVFDDLALFLIDKSGQVCDVAPNIKSANRIIGAKWSPDGRFVAIEGIAERPGRSTAQPLYILEASSGKLLEPNTGVRFIDKTGWLPDGQHLMAIGHSKLDTIGFPIAQMILIDALSGDVRTIFDNGEWGQIPVTTQWALSPDGHKIAIACPIESTQGGWQLVASRICLISIEDHAQ